MAGYNNIDQAVVLPQSVYPQVEERMYQRQQQRNREKEQQELREQSRRDSLMKMVGEEFSAKNYMTGTAGDPLIVNDLSGMLKKHSAELVKNPNISMAELYMKIQNDIGNVTQKASMFKAANSVLNETTKEFDKAKGIDGAAIKQLAMKRILAKAGNVDELSKVNPAEEVNRVIRENPDIYLDESTAYRTALKDFRLNDRSNTFETEQGGVTKRLAYNAKLYPFQEIVMDPKTGREVVNAGKVQYKTTSEIGMLDGREVALNGRPMQVMDAKTYNDWVASPVGNAMLIKDLNRFNAQSGKPPIEDGTPEGELLKNHFLYERLSKERPIDIDTKDVTSKDATLSKREQGWSPASVAGATASAVARELKKNESAKASGPGIIMGAAALSPEILDAAIKEPDGTYNITGPLGGIKLGFDADKKAIYGSVYIDPAKPGTAKVVTSSGTTTEYKGAALENFIKNVSGYNDWPLDKIKTAVGQYKDASGKLKVNEQGKIAAGAEQRRKDDLKKAFIPVAKTAIEEYDRSGQITYLDKFIGQTGKIDGSLATIQDIKLEDAGLFNVWNAEMRIDYTNPDGTQDFKIIKRPQSSGEMKKFLEEFIK